VQQVTGNLCGKKSGLVLLTFILISYLPAFTDSYSTERGFLVTQDSNITEPYTYIGFLGQISTDNPLKFLQEIQSRFTNECINGLVGQAKNRGADGIISITWKFQTFGNMGSYLIHCEGMAIKWEST
jgi:hypothetical protein